MSANVRPNPSKTLFDSSIDLFPNLKRLSEVMRKKVKIVAIPCGREDIENFVSIITYPVKFKAIEIKDNDAIINASNQSKASLIGRNRVRLNEMTNVLGQYFGIKKVMIR